MSFVSGIFKSMTLPRPSALALLLVAAAIGVGSASAQSDADPASVFNAAQDAHERGQIEQAIGLYRKALEIFPKFPEAELQLGNAYRQTGQLDLAEQAYRRALDLRRNWTLPMVSLASLLTSKGGYPEAENLLQDAIALGGENSGAYVLLTDLMLRRNAPEEDLRALLRAVVEMTSRPKTQPALLVARAMLERRLGSDDAASVSLKAALAADPNNTAALAESVELALRSRDSDSAVAFAERMEKVAPDSDETRLTLARAYAYAGENEKALARLEAIRTRDASAESLMRDLRIVAANDPSELERRLLEKPGDVLVMGRLCVLYRTASPLKSVDYCKRVLDTEPSNVDYASRYAAALVQAQKFSDAAALLLRLKQSAPDNYTVRANLATVFFQTKRWSEARVEYAWLQERQPSNAITYYLLGIVHDRLNEYIAALGQYQQFLALADPSKQRLEIEKVNLRLPGLKDQIKERKGR